RVSSERRVLISLGERATFGKPRRQHGGSRPGAPPHRKARGSPPSPPPPPIPSPPPREGRGRAPPARPAAPAALPPGAPPPPLRQSRQRHPPFLVERPLDALGAGELSDRQQQRGRPLRPRRIRHLHRGRRPDLSGQDPGVDEGSRKQPGDQPGLCPGKVEPRRPGGPRRRADEPPVAAGPPPPRGGRLPPASP